MPTCQYFNPEVHFGVPGKMTVDPAYCSRENSKHPKNSENKLECNGTWLVCPLEISEEDSKRD